MDVEWAFINSAYLSELWAVTDLIRFKKRFPSSWSPEREGQLEDEISHARRLLDAIQENYDSYTAEIGFSMQERLYRKYFDLKSSNSPSEHALVHEMTEKRAKWIYRTYLHLRPNSKHAPLIRQILAEEASHFHIDRATEALSPFQKQAVVATDRLLFRAYLPTRFGTNLLGSELFWKWYYQGAQLIRSPTKASPSVNSERQPERDAF